MLTSTSVRHWAGIWVNAAFEDGDVIGRGERAGVAWAPHHRQRVPDVGTPAGQADESRTRPCSGPRPGPWDWRPRSRWRRVEPPAPGAVSHRARRRDGSGPSRRPAPRAAARGEPRSPPTPWPAPLRWPGPAAARAARCRRVARPAHQAPATSCCPRPHPRDRRSPLARSSPPRRTGKARTASTSTTPPERSNNDSPGRATAGSATCPRGAVTIS